MIAWVLLWLSAVIPSAQAGGVGAMCAVSRGLLLQGAPAMGAEASEEDPARAARLAELEAAQAKKAAKVVVLSWPGAPEVGHEHGGLVRDVRTRIARPDARFYPDVDLYQSGRVDPSRAHDASQPGAVSQEDVDRVMAAVHDIESIPWNGLSEADWAITAGNLRALTDAIWFVDRAELRAPLFQLYLQIGRAAENMNNPVAPFYEHIGGQLLNYYWFLAGTLAYQDPAMLESISDAAMRDSIRYYSESIEAGSIPKMTLSFESGGVWDAKKFASEYQVFINGIEVVISDSQSLFEVPPGRIDVYLQRSDGRSLSDRVELDKLQDKIYFVRDVARKRMGVDLLHQLMEHPNECTPKIDGDILGYLAIYAGLHPDAEIYLAVPVAGNPNKVLLWRWSRSARTLTRVLDQTGGYPVRFAAFLGTGTVFNGANATVGQPYDHDEDPLTPDIVDPPDASLTIAGVPVSIQLRAHYGRLMLLTGVDATVSLTGAPWQDRYQTREEHSVVDEDGEEALREHLVSRMIYGGVGVVLFKKAALGIGPRAFARVGWSNLPHMLDTTAHVGITMEPPGTNAEGRVRLVLDADAFLGAMVPFGRTNRERAEVTFGLGVAAGTTF